MAELLALSWGGSAGSCWEITKCEPCCGEPCNAMDGIKCLACFAFCGLCSVSQLFAYSVNQECAIVNHFLPMCIFGACVSPLMRHNLRTKSGAGLPPGDTSGIIGDFIMTIFCGSCSLCQMLRSVDRDAWDWLGKVQENGVKMMADDWVFINGGGYSSLGGRGENSESAPIVTAE
eukprot:TRINITY_DN1441_c5_g1_i1.p1 TRINITY_DN1441_c5_g1~~TRINITY_DN1441_c5_g1_i1.p1  ORF type:complete len:175 (-),score=19.84 TRINITY_DN1441_c5_g1_i1:219-743(-)